MASTGSNRPRVDADEILQGIEEWVRIESPTYEAEAVNRMVDKVESQMQALGARLTRTPGRDGFGDILEARAPWGGDGPGILFLAHLDTVHPLGSLETILPWRREGDSVFGPGIYDMKGGGYLGYYAYRHLVREGRQSPLPITFLFIPEEEIGSPTSRRVIEETAKRNKYVLVAEPARDGGKVVTARKAVADLHMTVRGRPAHAGSRHQDGRSAIREIARQILRIEEFTDYESGVTASVGLVSGGTAINVVPAECKADIDMRLPDPETAERVLARVLASEPFDPDCIVEISGGLNRPAFEKDAGIAGLLTHAQDLARDLGFELQDCATGGGSDGNFTAALGIPTLDGLGVDGAGAHTDYEQLYYSSLEDRASLMIRLFETLE